MGRYATREDELDRLLRGGIFVDLYAVVRQAIRASVERYSIKNLEPLYGFARQIPLRRRVVAPARAPNWSLEPADAICTPTRLAAIESYNRDDCVSAGELRDWLEGVRAHRLAAGHDVPRPVPASPEPSEALNEHRLRVQAADGAPPGGRGR